MHEVAISLDLDETDVVVRFVQPDVVAIELNQGSGRTVLFLYAGRDGEPLLRLIGALERLREAIQ